MFHHDLLQEEAVRTSWDRPLLNFYAVHFNKGGAIWLSSFFAVSYMRLLRYG